MISEKLLREQIRRALRENSDLSEITDSLLSEKNDSDAKVSGSVGRGRLKQEIQNAKAYAVSDPEGLMSKLNVSSLVGDTDADKIRNMLSMSISAIKGYVRKNLKGKDSSSEGYTGVSKAKKTEDGAQIIVGHDEGLSDRDAALYVLHILTAAEKSNLLSEIKSSISVKRSGGGVIVVVQPMSNA